MRKKGIITAALAISLTLVSTFSSFAGQWRQDSTGWWWQEDDGSYPAGRWRWLDGNGDGVYEHYHFDDNGYLETNTTVENTYQVNADGAEVDSDNTLKLVRNGPSPDRQTKMLFTTNTGDGFGDNSEYMDTFTDLKPGVFAMWEASPFITSILKIEFIAPWIEYNYYEVEVADSEQYLQCFICIKIHLSVLF